MLKSNNKFTSAIKSIAIVLALIAVLVMSLAGCTDEDARQMAQDAADKANAAVTQTQLNDAVSAALADYAKKTDVMTQDGVATVVTEALKDYAKTADVLTMAQVETAIANALADRYTKAEVDALISGLKTELQKLVNDQATELQNYADKQIADLKAAWDILTGDADDILNLDLDKIANKDYSEIDTVVEACAVVDILMADVVASKDGYTKANYELAIALCEAAKVQYIRAHSLTADDVKDLADEIDSIPTIYTEALEVADLIAAIPVPMTTADSAQAAVKAAREAYTTWCKDYNADQTIFETKTGDTTLVGRMEYAENKLANILVPAYEALNAEIAKYITAKGITLPTDPDAETVVAAMAGKVLIGDEATLAAIFDAYNAFVGDIDEITDYTLDDDDNNGTDDGRVPYWSVIVDCFEQLNNAKFIAEKTLLVGKINGEMDAIVSNLAGAADAIQNDVLRNKIGELEIKVVDYITTNLTYDSKYGYTNADGTTANYQEVYAKALEHINAIKAALTTPNSVLQAIVDNYYTLLGTNNNDYTAANATLDTEIANAMVNVEKVVAYAAN